MKKVLSLAFLNFKEATRNKLFYGVIFFFILYLSFCVLLGKLSPGETEKVLRGAGLAGIELTAFTLIIFSIILSFYREKENRILEVYLSNFKKSAYISGKLSGYFAICLFYLFLSGIIYSAILYFFGVFTPVIWAGLFSIFLKLSIIISFCLIFSSFFSSSLLALLCSIFIYAASEVAPQAVKIVSISGSKLQKIIAGALYCLLPNMDKIDIKYSVIYGKLPSLAFFTSITFYTFIYILFLWIVAILIFQRKEY